MFAAVLQAFISQKPPVFIPPEFGQAVCGGAVSASCSWSLVAMRAANPTSFNDH